jgi:hypothetical protein
LSEELGQTICENKQIEGGTATEEIINDGTEVEEDFVEKYLEPFFLILGVDLEFFEDIKREHFAHGASVSRSFGCHYC